MSAQETRIDFLLVSLSFNMIIIIIIIIIVIMHHWIEFHKQKVMKPKGMNL